MEFVDKSSLFIALAQKHKMAYENQEQNYKIMPVLCVVVSCSVSYSTLDIGFDHSFNKC